MELNLRKEAEKPRARLKPINREQMVMRPMDVEQLVSEDYEVRAIWEFMGRVDLSQYYEDIGVIEGEAGHPPFDPRLMISLWIYTSPLVESLSSVLRDTTNDSLQLIRKSLVRELIQLGQITDRFLHRFLSNPRQCEKEQS